MWRGSSVDYWTQTIDTNEKTEWADILCRTAQFALKTICKKAIDT